MGVFETGMIFYIPIGTFLLNRLRVFAANKTSSIKVIYFILTMAMAAMPLYYIRSIATDYSALSVILVGIAFFWFPIVSSRVTKS